VNLLVFAIFDTAECYLHCTMCDQSISCVSFQFYHQLNY